VALDARIASDYRENGEKKLEDISVNNTGQWRHSAWKYFSQRILCDALIKILAQK
jgi:hypothetical protein